MNIVKLVNRQAQLRPDALALRRGAHSIRFGQLARALHNLATHLSAQGIGPGDRVGIALSHSPLHVVTTLALARLRVVSMPVHALHPPATRQAIVDHFKPAVITAQRAEHGVDKCNLLLIDPAWLRKPAEAKLPAIDEDVGNKEWHIHLSSGTTGLPKGVIRTHRDALTQMLFQASVIPSDAATRFLCVMDLNAGASLMRALRYLVKGSAVIFPEDNGWEPVRAVLTENEPAHTFISPSHLSRWLKDLGNRRAASTGFTYVAVGGGRLSNSLKERANQQITQSIFTCYGSTETGLMALQYPDDPQQEHESLGRIVPWAEVQVVDADDQPLPAGEQGRLRFRGHGFATSYHNNAEATARFFRSGWFYPGDVGRVTPRGSIFVETREDDMLNVRGLKVLPSESESVLAAHPAVVEAAAFRATSAAGEDFLVAAVIKREPINDRELLKYCREKLGPRAPHRVVGVRELPRDAMGKVIRSELIKQIKPRSQQQ